METSLNGNLEYKSTDIAKFIYFPDEHGQEIAIKTTIQWGSHDEFHMCQPIGNTSHTTWGIS